MESGHKVKAKEGMEGRELRWAASSILTAYTTTVTLLQKAQHR